MAAICQGQVLGPTVCLPRTFAAARHPPNWNSAAKAAPGCVVANDGSNAANGHGSTIVARSSSGGANGSKHWQW